MLICFLPVFSFKYLKDHREELNDPQFITAFGTLYTNLITDKTSAYIMPCIFCVKRLLIALATVFMQDFILMSIYIYSFSSLFSIGYIIRKRPMKSQTMNRMEQVNEWALYITSLFMFLFTEWIPDISTRYTLGYIFMPTMMTIVSINLGCVFYEMYRVFSLSYRRWKLRRKVQKRQ